MSTLHDRAKTLFVAALARPASERPAFVAEACGDDDALRREVESLLEFHEEADESTAGQDTSDNTRFAPGDIFAGRYRMVARIGRGGMGDVWRADDLVLDCPVALKLITSSGAEARQRILQEVRLARQITHGSVCRVFDVGQTADGAVFYSMELVRGEDLASLLRRVGRLPSDRVVDIARQLCAGLAAAHAQGILHRDLKPANVLIGDDGSVRITDFGIAIPRTDASLHMRTGTPGYMAPEQRSPGTALSERTDVYALGLVLYELLTGRHPFSGPGAASVPPRPSTFIPHVNAQLERTVMQAIALDPRERWASALELAANLPDIGTRRDTDPATTRLPIPRGRTRPWMAIAGLAAGIVVLAVLASYFFGIGIGGRLTEQDTIVLADVENATGDTVFDGALKVALAVALEQSPFLNVFPDERARETLRLMQRAPEERITRTVAREIARREHLKALIAGSITTLGRNYVFTLEAINADTGDVMAREQAEAASKEQVLTALGQATARLREKLGESLASVQKFDVPLPRATTQSLDALHAYALALSDGAEVPRLEAIPHLERAIELDPNFAMAHAFLSGVYANTGQSALAPAYSRKAFELRDRVSERERFFISWRYYRDALQDWEKGLELARSWTATYPREAFAFNALGVAYIRLGRFEESVTPFREAIRLDPEFVPAYSNLSAALLALDRYDEARRILQDAADRQLEFAGARRLSYLLAFVQGDGKTMARELASSLGPDDTNAAWGWQAHTSGFLGQVRTSHEQFRRGIQLALQGDFTQVAAQLTTEDAETHAIFGQCTEAVSEANAALALGRDNSTLERAGRVLALCGNTADAARISNELARRFPDATLTMRVSLPVTAAIVALQQGNPRRALESLERVRPYDHAPSAEFWPSYVRGLAYLELNDGASATGEFKAIVDHRGEVPASPLYPLAHLGMARAAMLRNDQATARTAYGAFLAFWKDADNDVPELQRARHEQARLGAGVAPEARAHVAEQQR